MSKLAIAGCKHTTKELIEGLLRLQFRIDCVITISPEKALDQQVAGYYDLRPFLTENSIPFIVATKYSLLSDADQQSILPLEIDVLLVMGWQRLIPEWFLSNLSVGAFGMHGSNKPLPHGRGRSPLNWSLLLGKNIFFTHLFRYKPGVDDGDIVGYQTFDITPWDDCLTLHLKNLLAMLSLCEKYLPDILLKKVSTFPQKNTAPSYFPKRSEEDGVINWELSSKDIHNLIRSVTQPFPGAFTFLHTEDSIPKITIWEAIPFDTHLNWYHANAGEILFVFEQKMFLVKTGDTTLLVKKYDGYHITSADIGKVFHNNGIQFKKWDNLPI